MIIIFKRTKAKRGDILIYRSTEENFIGNLISIFSNFGRKNSKIFHVGVYFGSGQVIQSSLTVDHRYLVSGNHHSGGHISVIPKSDYEKIDIYRLKTNLTQNQVNLLLNWMKNHFYDYDLNSFSETFYRSVICRLLNWNNLAAEKPDNSSNHEKKYNCAEYVANAYKQSLDINLVPRLHPNNYNPADFSYSDKLIRIC